LKYIILFHYETLSWCFFFSFTRSVWMFERQQKVFDQGKNAL